MTLLNLLGFIPAVFGFYLGATGQIAGNAVKEFEHLLGIWALRWLVATLAVTPLRDLFGVNLLPWRRALGLLDRAHRRPRGLRPSVCAGRAAWRRSR